MACNRTQIDTACNRVHIDMACDDHMLLGRRVCCLRVKETLGPDGRL